MLSGAASPQLSLSLDKGLMFLPVGKHFWSTNGDVMEWKQSFLLVFLGQNSSYLPDSAETLQTDSIKDTQYLSFLSLIFKCQKVFLFPGGLDAL